jgi:hypothetical protein
MLPVNYNQNLIGKKLVERLIYFILNYLYTKIKQKPKKG